MLEFLTEIQSRNHVSLCRETYKLEQIKKSNAVLKYIFNLDSI